MARLGHPAAGYDGPPPALPLGWPVPATVEEHWKLFEVAWEMSHRYMVKIVPAPIEGPKPRYRVKAGSVLWVEPKPRYRVPARGVPAGSPMPPPALYRVGIIQL